MFKLDKFQSFFCLKTDIKLCKRALRRKTKQNKNPIYLRISRIFLRKWLINLGNIWMFIILKLQSIILSKHQFERFSKMA